MEPLIFCTGFVMFFVVLFAFILAWRYLNYRETLALAEKGLVKPARQRNGSGKASLVWGIIIAAIGTALTLGLWPLGLTGAGRDYPLGLGPWMLAGFIPLFFGMALVLIYVLTREGKKKDADESLDAPLAVPEAIDRALEE